MVYYIQQLNTKKEQKIQEWFWLTPPLSHPNPLPFNKRFFIDVFPYLEHAPAKEDDRSEANDVLQILSDEIILKHTVESDAKQIQI